MVQTVQKTMEIPQMQCIDKVLDDHVVQVVHVQQLQVVEKIVEIPEIQMVLGTQTCESLRTEPVRQVAQAEIVEAVEMGVPLLADSASPRFVKAPVLESTPVVVKCAPIGWPPHERVVRASWRRTVRARTRQTLREGVGREAHDVCRRSANFPRREEEGKSCQRRGARHLCINGPVPGSCQSDGPRAQSREQEEEVFPLKQTSHAVQTSRTLIGSTSWSYHLLKKRLST